MLLTGSFFWWSHRSIEIVVCEKPPGEQHLQKYSKTSTSSTSNRLKITEILLVAVNSEGLDLHLHDFMHLPKERPFHESRKMKMFVLNLFVCQASISLNTEGACPVHLSWWFVHYLEIRQGHFSLSCALKNPY